MGDAPDNPSLDPAEVRAQALKDILESVPMALRSIKEIAEMGDSEQVRLAASIKLLGLAGITEVQKTEVDVGAKRAQEEVDHELALTLSRLDEGRRKRALQSAERALPAGEVLDAQSWEGDESGGTQASCVPLEGSQQTLDLDLELDETA